VLCNTPEDWTSHAKSLLTSWGATYWCHEASAPLGSSCVATCLCCLLQRYGQGGSGGGGESTCGGLGTDTEQVTSLGLRLYCWCTVLTGSKVVSDGLMSVEITTWDCLLFYSELPISVRCEVWFFPVSGIKVRFLQTEIGSRYKKYRELISLSPPQWANLVWTFHPYALSWLRQEVIIWHCQ
jgi:hypothetical protein